MGVEISLFEYVFCGIFVMPREGHGSRNYKLFAVYDYGAKSCPARGMGVEILMS